MSRRYLRIVGLLSLFVLISSGMVEDNGPKTAVISFAGERSFDGFGYSLSSVYDVSGDEFSDILIGAFSSSGLAGAGHVYLFHGGEFGGGNVEAGNAPLIIVGEHLGDQFGFSVSVDGDYNADGIHDITIGARNNSTDLCGRIR